MSIAAFDRIATNHQCLLSLPFREGSGIITRDVAKPNHQDIDLVGFPNWVRLDSGLGVLEFDGAGDYLECAAAKTADLNFTTEDYSITCWIYKEHSATSDMVIARYALDLDGWELYFYEPTPHHYLTLRHHHGSLGVDRTGCYSDDWPLATWCLLGITRSGAYPKHYRNGQELVVTYDVGGLGDPDTSNRDLVVGCRFSKNSDWYTGKMRDPRIWLGELSSIQMKTLFDMDAHWFGVN